MAQRFNNACIFMYKIVSGLGHCVFEICHLLFSFVFAIMVDRYIDKRKGSSEGGLSDNFL